MAKVVDEEVGGREAGIARRCILVDCAEIFDDGEN